MFIAWIVLALVCGLLGKSKKIGFWGAFFLSLILTPIIGFIVAILSPDEVEQPTVPVNTNSVSEQLNTSAPIGDQLKQLYELKEAGAITQEEFEVVKSKLIYNLQQDPDKSKGDHSQSNEV